ncbi:BTAD domain-containing putative transcriptional regulator [Micromonospora sp. LOL_015]|uniref:AfsR/SARP family transcriptional regulator n=1 Tax=Micromonospora sp. LOL_015 TaxID=3345416 RepID=UPI003A8C688B
MKFRILGPMEIEGTHGLVDIRAKRLQVIQMLLLVEANRVVPFERLIEALWDENPPNTARAQIHICISRLRRICDRAGLPDIIGTTSAGYILRVPEDQLDLQVFERLVRLARVAAGEGRYLEADDCYRQAIALWRGDTLNVGNSRVLQAFETRLTEQRISVLEEWVDVRLELGVYHDLVGDLTDLVARFPLRERSRAQLMIALYRSGRQAEALEVYRAGRNVLVEELGIEPSEELQRLERDILSGVADLGGATATVPAAVTPTATVPPVIRPVTPHLLPADISDFTGRAEQIALLRRNLLPDRSSGPCEAVPIVTVNGKPGVGKTTLAVHVSHELADSFADGQLFIQLHGLSARPVTAAQALERFLRALGIPGEAIPEGLEERAEAYRQWIADRRILVVLDDAADEEQVRWLLPGSANCAVIVTSRFRLTGIPGAVPVEVDVLSDEQALSLIVKIVGPDMVHAGLNDSLELIALCGRLPIALRIAAARLAARAHWTVGQLVERLKNQSQRLDELAHRGQGVRASLALTYEILSGPARKLLRRLGMLEMGDFADWIAAPLLGTTVAEAVNVLEELVDAQFVEVKRTGNSGQIRFKLHNLIRVYAQERLAQEEQPAERAKVMARALGAWMFMADEAHRREYGGDYALVHGIAERWPLPEHVVKREFDDPIGWYEAERLNIVAAIRQAAANGLHELCWDLAATSVTLFEARRYFDDWRVTHEIALAEARRADNRRGEAVMLCSLGTLHLNQRQFEEAAQRLTLAMQLFGEVGDEHGQWLAMRGVAFLDRMHGRWDAAELHYDEAITGLRKAGDRLAVVQVMSSLAEVHIERGALT